MQLKNRRFLPLVVIAALIMTCFMQSSVLEAHEDIHGQIAALSEKIDEDPENTELYLRRGELYRAHRDWEAALADYEHAARLTPKLDTVYLYRGMLWFDRGRPEDAKKELDRFLKDHPDHVQGLIVRARALVKLNHISDAVKDFTRALAQRPNPDIYLERAKTLVSGTDDQIDEALIGLDEGMKTLGSLVTLQLYAIELELKQKRYDAALQRLDQISAQSERQESWLARRGDILLKAGRMEEAREAYSAAISALEALPETRRNTRSMLELERHINECLNHTAEF